MTFSDRDLFSNIASFYIVETSAGLTRERRNIAAEIKIVRSEIVLKRRRVLRYLIIWKIRNG